MQLESQKKEFELRGRELEQREAQNENESKYLAEEIEKVHSFLLPSFHRILEMHKRVKKLLKEKVHSFTVDSPNNYLRVMISRSEGKNECLLLHVFACSYDNCSCKNLKQPLISDIF